MSKSEIAEFAQVLMREVRDATIASCDTLLDPTANGVVAKRWRAVFDTQSPKDVASAVIPDCVDETLFHLLRAIDEGFFRISFVNSSGITVDLAGEGELAGWFLRTGGWRAEFSKERFVDDFVDLS